CRATLGPPDTPISVSRKILHRLALIRSAVQPAAPPAPASKTPHIRWHCRYCRCAAPPTTTAALRPKTPPTDDAMAALASWDCTPLNSLLARRSDITPSNPDLTCAPTGSAASSSN